MVRSILAYADSHANRFPNWQAEQGSLKLSLPNRSDALSQFEYLLPTGNLVNRPHPRTTQLGFVPYAGGQAVAYADGHIEMVEGPSAAEVGSRAMTALDMGDGAALCRLANEDELQRLNIGPTEVARILDQTLWKGGQPVYRHPLTRTRPDDAGYAKWQYAADIARRETFGLYIPTYLGQDGRWYLAISRLLEASFRRRNPPISVEAMRNAYRQAARKCGIKGVRGFEGGWVMFSPPGVPQNWRPMRAKE